MMPFILFLGCETDYSQQVKQALIKAKYSLVAQPSQADLIIAACYGQKISNTTLNQPKHGGLNLHPSLLPKYRGPTPIPTAILNQEKTTGITIIKMTDKIDAGPILIQKPVAIKPTDTSLHLLNRCYSLGAKLLINILPDYINKQIAPKPQNHSQASYTKKFTKQDGYISWPQFSHAIKGQFKTLDHKIRALYPWPGVWTSMPNNKTLKLLPNQQLQLEGKQPITITQFLAGYKKLID